MEKQQLSLSDLQYLIKDTLEDAFSDLYWIKAEISEMTVNRSGHCYLDLVETDAANNVISRVRATIWSYSFRMLKPYFESTTGQLFTEGIKVLLQAKVEYHELYGLSLNIRDIDPTYTMGDMARQRKEIINRLEEEGVLEMNKELQLPLVPQKIAIISSPTAAGLQDFMDQLHNNQHRAKFYTKLFPAVMQGKEAPESIMAALDRIFEYENIFDAVAIIRGGGAQVDLAAFDHYDLAFHVTQFPLPVITGIGHDKDDSVVDLVAHTRLKTPTAVAEFLISSVAEFLSYMNELEGRFAESVNDILQNRKETINGHLNRFQNSVRSRLKDERQFLEISNLKLKSATENYFHDKNNSFNQLAIKIKTTTISFIKYQQNSLGRSIEKTRFGSKSLFWKNQNQLENIQHEIKIRLEDKLKFENQKLRRLTENLRLVDPEKILKRGYSLTLKDGKIVKSVKQIDAGDEIETRMSDGKLKSKVTSK